MGDKTIRVSERTWRELSDRKRDGESFDDVIKRLNRDKWSGFGALADSGITDGIEAVHADLEAAFETNLDGTDR